MKRPGLRPPLIARYVSQTHKPRSRTTRIRPAWPRLEEGVLSYSIQRAGLIAEQLERLATQHAHQLAGQVANLAFWISEAVGAISILDDYAARFLALRNAQVGWVK